MIRVGFFNSLNSSGWTGGTNYSLNLLHALSSSRLVCPVLFTNPNAPIENITALKNVETVRTIMADPAGRWTLARRMGEKLYGRAFMLEALLRRYGVSVLSHSGHLGPRASIPTIGWIPDFQHRRMPDFFTKREQSDRNRVFGNLADYCTRIVVSSADARSDFASFRPDAIDKVRVFHFASGLHEQGSTDPTLLSRYGIERPYFHLPNQFWMHKNHITVIEALAIIRRKGRSICVVATGNTRDYRHPHHFTSLQRRIREDGLEADFRILGLVPIADLAGLMRSSVAVINPSLFEGWSTTVEEAKAIGKTILLSDIPVHREQAPPHGVYFPPKDAADLADKLLATIDAYTDVQEVQRQQRAIEALPSRIASFRARFEEIALDAAGSTP